MALVYLTYVTCKDLDEATRIARDVVSCKLAACANMLPEMQTVYEWENKIMCEKECVLILKSGESSLNQLTEKIKQLHSYQTPCIVSWKIEHGHPDFLEWVRLGSQS